MDVNNGMKIKKIDNGRELFYGVVAVASFIVMAVGATFAYFTATASSANSSVTTGSTTLELEYISYNNAWMRDDLIPANTAVVEYSVEYQDDTTPNKMCVDDYGNSICSVYQFKVINNANSPQTVSLDVVSEENGFASLNAMAYELVVIEDDSETEEVDEGADYIAGARGEGESLNENSTDPVFKSSENDNTVGAVTVSNGDGELLYGDDIPTPVYVNRKGVRKTLLKYKDPITSTETNTVMLPAINRLVVPVTEENVATEAKTRTVRVADNITIYGVNDPDGNPNFKDFIIVLYIRNSNVDQTKTDAKKTFTGRVVVSNGDGTTGVSGSISAVADQDGNVKDENELQSGIETNEPGVTTP